MKVDLEQFKKDYDAEFVVLSRDRAEALKQKSDKILRGYHLFYSGKGYDETEYNCTDRTEVPRGLHGVTAVRNFILDRLDQKIVMFFDDDLGKVYWLGSTRSVALTPSQIQLACINLIQNALDMDARVFGFSDLDIRKASPLSPFALRSVVTSVYGVIGRELRYDERNMLKSDYDFALMSLRDHRVVFKDLRYFASHDKDIAPGGNMAFRTNERREREIRNLVDWWGDDVVVTNKRNKTNESLSIVAPK